MKNTMLARAVIFAAVDAPADQDQECVPECCDCCCCDDGEECGLED